MKSLIAMALLSSALAYAKPATEKSNAAGGGKPADKAKDAKPATPAPTTAEADGGRSIINPKYRDKYKDPDYKPDFVAELIDDAALTKDEKGKSQGLNQSLMLDLAAKRARAGRRAGWRGRYRGCGGFRGRRRRWR